MSYQPSDQEANTDNYVEEERPESDPDQEGRLKKIIRRAAKFASDVGKVVGAAAGAALDIAEDLGLGASDFVTGGDHPDDTGALIDF